MVVEDDDGIRTALRLALLDEGYDVVAVPSAEEALEVLRGTEVDLMLVDLMLGGMDGYTFIRTARASHDVPVIVLSARNDTHDIVAALEAGADDYVTKPFELKEVTARLRALRRRGPRVGASSPDRPPEHRAGRLLDARTDLMLDETAGRVTRGGPGRPADRHRVPAAVRARVAARPRAEPGGAAAQRVGPRLLRRRADRRRARPPPAHQGRAGPVRAVPRRDRPGPRVPPRHPVSGDRP